MNKKLFRKLNILILTLALIFGCTATSFAGTKEYKGSTGGLYTVGFDFTIDMDYDWFIKGDNTVYSMDLGRLATVFCNASYEDPNGIVKFRSIAGNGTRFYTAMGLSDVTRKTCGSSTNIDTDDIATIFLGHKKYSVDGKTYEIIFATVRGTVELSEWASNMDFGYDDPEYYEETGEHPEWTNKAIHKGFCVAANRVYSAIENYADSKTDSTAERIYFITGHSRGASIANIIGTYYEDADEYKTFTYTVATPSVTTESVGHCESYKTIFNLVNEDDLLANSIPENWAGFRRYGKTYYVAGNTVASKFKNITGRTYSSEGAEDLFNDYAGSEFITRKELYESDDDDSSYYTKIVAKLLDGSLLSWHMPAVYYCIAGLSLNDSIKSFMPYESFSASVFSDGSVAIYIGIVIMAMATVIIVTVKKRKKV